MYRLSWESSVKTVVFVLATAASGLIHASDCCAGPRTIIFSGRQWDVRREDEPVYPGPNCFSDSTGNVWVDEWHRLHLKATQVDGRWYCAEVNLREHLGYGAYIFQVEGMIGAMDRNVVVGIFNYDSDTSAENHREFDMEFSMWGRMVSPNAEYVVQPWTAEGNLHRWDMARDVSNSTHSYTWMADSIYFTSGRGFQSLPPFDSALGQWTYTKKSGIPEPGGERVTLNIWLFEGMPPSDSIEPEIVFNSFNFLPAPWVHRYGDGSSPRIRFLENRPNPFHESTSIRFEMSFSAHLSLAVYDVAGRRIRALFEGDGRAGLHWFCWDGLDEAGAAVCTGVYFCRVEAGGVTDAIPLVLLR